MFDQTGCESPFARDSLLTPSGVEVEGGNACFVPLPFYYVTLVPFSIILFMVALIRTNLVTKFKKQKASTRRMSAYVTLGGTFKKASPYIVVLSSWGAFFVSFLFLLLPLVTNPLNDSLIFLLGLQYLFFCILGYRWLVRMIRLGAKIITAPSKKIGTSSSDSQEQAALEFLQHSDAILSVMRSLTVCSICMQFLSLCILQMIYRDSTTWLRVGLGLQGFNVCILLCAISWQLQRCINAIVTTTARVQGVAQSPPNRSVDVVVRKFRRMQLIVVSFGLAGVLVFLLWGIGVFNISYLVILASGFFDACVNIGVVTTFLKRGSKRRHIDTGPTGTGSGNVKLGEARTVLGESSVVTFAGDKGAVSQYS